MRAASSETDGVISSGVHSFGVRKGQLMPSERLYVTFRGWALTAIPLLGLSAYFILEYESTAWRVSAVAFLALMVLVGGGFVAKALELSEEGLRVIPVYSFGVSHWNNQFIPWSEIEQFYEEKLLRGSPRIRAKFRSDPPVGRRRTAPILVGNYSRTSHWDKGLSIDELVQLLNARLTRSREQLPLDPSDERAST